jgi:hypothetical protein
LLNILSNQIHIIMQFIDFKKEHFTKDPQTNDFTLDISKEEVGFGEIKVQERKDDEIHRDAEFEVIDDLEKITIRMKKPVDIRVNF